MHKVEGLEVNIDIFKSRITIFEGKHSKELSDKYGWIELPENVAGRIVIHDGSIVIRLADEGDTTTLVHEAVHAAMMISDYIGHEYSMTKDRDEVIPYIVEYIYKEYLNYQKQKKKATKK